MSSVLEQALGQGSIKLQQSCVSWRETFELAGLGLVESSRTTSAYIQEMIQAFEELGPYMVIAPGIALAHGRPSEAVLETGLSLVTLSTPVVFGSTSNDPVSLVIGLAAVDHDSHIDLMAALSELLMSEDTVNSLLRATNESEVRSYLS
jgi:PTS system ascorbate-specific IIA component